MGTLEAGIFECCDELSIFIRKLERLSEFEVVLPWAEQLGRLKVWIEENRIARKGQPSLEQRLDGSSHIISALIEILSTLSHTIQSCVYSP
jgi:hypothetical protein